MNLNRYVHLIFIEYVIQVDLSAGVWTTVSNAAKNVVRRTLHVDPTKRPTTDQLLTDPWLEPDHTLPLNPQSTIIQQVLYQFILFIKVF